MPARFRSPAVPGAVLVAALSVALALPAAAEVATRTANDGQVVLEGVPEIPRDVVESLTRYQNTRGARFEDWDETGRGLYITTRFGNTTQIHHVAMPGGARRQITFLDEPVSGADREPVGRRLVFESDQGGGEFYQIFLLDPKTGDRQRLTDGSSRNGAALWSPDGRRIAYRSTRRNGRSNDVWVMDVDAPDAARVVVEAPDGSSWGPADWSTDGKRLVVQQYVSVTDSRIYMLDLATRELRPLAGSAEAPSVNLAGELDAGDQGLFFVTDEGSEFRHLARLDLASGKRRVITGDIPWDVESFELSDSGRRAAFVVDEDGTDRLYLLDPTSLAYRRVERLPVGLVGGLEFSPDDARLALTLNTAKSPSDVYTVELGAGATVDAGLTRWTESEVGGLDPAGFVEPQLVHYPTFDQVDGRPRAIPAYVYRPQGPGPHPVIVDIHGGPEGQYRPGFSSTIQLWVATLGAAVVAPNVRGSSGYGKTYVALDNGMKREDSVKDIGALLDWIATQPDLDTGRVAVVGGSYGGYMVLASLVHYSDRLKAGVDIVGISNFVTFLEHTQDYRRDLRRVEYGDERDPEMRAFLDGISPNRHPESIKVPLFVAAGANDPRVPQTESAQIVRAVRGQGYDVWYMRALNEGHGFRKKENRDLYDQIVVLFLQQHL
jgi:dipeptidyl aminopeptidase/acylaminoacyl peptidase